MINIYFDQFAISCLAGTETSYIWNMIYEDLLYLKSQNKIRCFTSPETIFETSQRHSAGINDNYSTVSKLFNNYYLNDIRTIICQQIAKCIKGIDSSPFVRVNYDFTSDEFNFNLRNAMQNKFDSEEIIACPIEMTRVQIACLIKWFYENGRINFIESIDSMFTGKLFDSYYSDICITLIKYFNFTIKDFIHLRKNLICNDLIFFPTLRIQNILQPYMLFSQSGIRHKIDFRNDIIDIRRISSAIPYSNVVFCDSKWKNCIKLLGIDAEYNTHLFSGKQEDLIEFKRFILSLQPAA